MKLDIHIFRRKHKPEGTGHLERHGTEPESLYRKKSHDVVEQKTVSRW